MTILNYYNNILDINITMFGILEQGMSYFNN